MNAEKDKIGPYELNRVHCGHILDMLPQIPDESVQCIVTSPPYWGLRDYKIPPSIWENQQGQQQGLSPSGDCPNDPSPPCHHEWSDSIISSANDSNRGAMEWTTGADPGAKVLDPFAGTAKTGQVAISLGRRFIGFDISAEYVRKFAQPRIQAAVIFAQAAEKGLTVKELEAGQGTLFPQAVPE